MEIRGADAASTVLILGFQGPWLFRMGCETFWSDHGVPRQLVCYVFARRRSLSVSITKFQRANVVEVDEISYVMPHQVLHGVFRVPVCLYWAESRCPLGAITDKTIFWNSTWYCERMIFN